MIGKKYEPTSSLWELTHIRHWFTFWSVALISLAACKKINCIAYLRLAGILRRPPIQPCLLQGPLLLQFGQRALFRYCMLTYDIIWKHLAIRRISCCQWLIQWNQFLTPTSSTSSTDYPPLPSPPDHRRSPGHFHRIVRNPSRCRTDRTPRRMIVRSEAS